MPATIRFTKIAPTPRYTEMKSTLLLAITSVLFGCVHPAFENETMSFQSLPQDVKTTFEETTPDASVLRVTKETFQNKHTGYNIWFVDSAGEKKAASYTSEGTLEHIQPYRGEKEHNCNSHD